MRQYQVQHLRNLRLSSDLSACESQAVSAPSIRLPTDAEWAGLPAAQIDHYLPVQNRYQPQAEARLARDEQALYVLLQVAEKHPLITWQKHQDPVYKDSCLEFFIQANPAFSTRYFNFEFNAAGVVLSAYGEGRHNRTALSAAELETLVIEPRLVAGNRTDLESAAWRIACRIPRTLLEDYCGPINWMPNQVMMGNFYKCGDQTADPHYGCWNLVAKPDFHRPEDFGRLVFV